MLAKPLRHVILSGLLLIVAITMALACAAALPTQDGANMAEERGVAPTAPESAPSAAPPAQGAGSAAGDLANAPWDRMVIRNASLVLVVEDVERALAAARDAANQVGGFVGQSETRYQGEHLTATLTLQVPSSELDAVVQRLRDMAVKVASERGSSQDVTEEYVDLQARLVNLEATEARMRALLDRADRIEDILTIERELTQVRGEIERIKGRLQFLQRRTDYATITLTLLPPALEPRSGVSAWDPVRTIERAWEASLRVLQIGAEVLLTLVVFFWWLVPVVAIGWPLVRLILARRRAAGTPQA